MKKTYLDDVETRISPAAPPDLQPKSLVFRKILCVVIALLVYVGFVLVLFLAPGGFKLLGLILMLLYSFFLVKPFFKLLTRLFKLPTRSGDV